MDHALLSFTNFNAGRLSQIPYIWVQGPMAPAVRIAYLFNHWHSPELWPLWLSSASGFWVWCLWLSCCPAVCDTRVATSLYGKECQLVGTHLENATPYQYGDNDAGLQCSSDFLDPAINQHVPRGCGFVPVRMHGVASPPHS